MYTPTSQASTEKLQKKRLQFRHCDVNRPSLIIAAESLTRCLKHSDTSAELAGLNELVVTLELLYNNFSAIFIAYNLSLTQGDSRGLERDNRKVLLSVTRTSWLQVRRAADMSLKDPSNIGSAASFFIQITSMSSFRRIPTMWLICKDRRRFHLRRARDKGMS